MTTATLEDVAKRANVSIKTVSRVVNNEPNVRESTRQRVTAAIDALNYRPHKSARNLKSRRSHLIGLIYDDPGQYNIPSAGYVINIQEGVLAVCKANNYDLLIHPCSYRNPDIVAELHALIENSRLDGIVLAPPLSGMSKIINAIRKTGTPLVGISPGEKKARQLAVHTDDREVCAAMTGYLASLGHKRIGYIDGHPDHKAVASRILGYQDGLEANGLKLHKRLICHGDNSIRSGERCAEILLDRKDPPTAIFACNDDMAAGVMRVAHQRGIRVPEELSVAGFDDISLAQQIYPSLTTIKQPLEEMAKQAADMLISGFGSQSAKTAPQLVPSEIIVRESTGPAPP